MANRTNGWNTLKENIDQTEVKVSVQTTGRNAGVTTVRYHTPDGWRMILISPDGAQVRMKSGATLKSVKTDWKNVDFSSSFDATDEDDEYGPDSIDNP